MITWDNLKQYHLNPPHNRLSRSVDINQNYESYKRTHTNTTQIIIDRNFKNNDKTFSIELNNFPYDVEDNIEHFVLWINPNKEHEIVNNTEIYKYIESHFENKVIYFENNINNRSINLRHFHIFYKLYLIS